MEVWEKVWKENTSYENWICEVGIEENLGASGYLNAVSY